VLRSLSADPNIRLTLHIPERVPTGSVVEITMRIENVSAEPVELYLRGLELTCDFVVTAPNGDIVWRRLEGQVVPAILRLEVLRPGLAIECRDSWCQVNNAGDPVVPGPYAVHGVVLTEGSSTLESAALSFRIGGK